LTHTVYRPFPIGGPLIGTDIYLSLAIFEILGTSQSTHDLDLSGSHDVIGRVTIRFPINHFLFPSLDRGLVPIRTTNRKLPVGTQSSISNGF